MNAGEVRRYVQLATAENHLTHGQRAVYGELVRRANPKTGEIRPLTYAELRAQLGYGRRTIGAAVRVLEELGLVDVVQRGNGREITTCRLVIKP